jgi:hypothetical protein
VDGMWRVWGGAGGSLGKATVQFLTSPRRSVVHTFTSSGVSRCPSGMSINVPAPNSVLYYTPQRHLHNSLLTLLAHMPITLDPVNLLTL